MKRITVNSRRLKKRLRSLSDILSQLLSIPFVKPSLLIISALCILLIAAPYILTRLSPNTDQPEKELLPKADFQLAEAPETITIYRTETGKTETVDFEDYVKGVVSGEMPSSFHIEALKAQAVAARTYSLARVLKAQSEGNPDTHPDAPLCDSTHCQVYRSTSELKDLKGKDWMDEDYEKICQAVDETKGQLLYYKGQLVEQALFHSSSGGKTENSEDVFAAAVPYLVSVDSPYEDEATHQQEEHSFSISELADAVKTKYPNVSFGTIDASSIKIISRSSGDSVEEMQIGSGTLKGTQIREALELPSADFTIDISGDTVTFTSNGSGHGVGMSQYGADGMAKKGYDYKDILSHYYSGTEVY